MGFEVKFVFCCHKIESRWTDFKQIFVSDFCLCMLLFIRNYQIQNSEIENLKQLQIECLRIVTAAVSLLYLSQYYM